MSEVMPRRPRWWKLRKWSPHYAQWEWRELAAVAAKLQKASKLVAEIEWDFRYADYRLAVTGLETMASSLARMSSRWQQRADQAKRYAIKDENIDFLPDKAPLEGPLGDWFEVWTTKIHEDIAADVLVRAAAELDTAATELQMAAHRRSEIQERVLRLREEVEEISHEIISRDYPRQRRHGWE